MKRGAYIPYLETDILLYKLYLFLILNLHVPSMSAVTSSALEFFTTASGFSINCQAPNCIRRSVILIFHNSELLEVSRVTLFRAASILTIFIHKTSAPELQITFKNSPLETADNSPSKNNKQRFTGIKPCFATTCWQFFNILT